MQQSVWPPACDEFGFGNQPKVGELFLPVVQRLAEAAKIRSVLSSVGEKSAMANAIILLSILLPIVLPLLIS